MAWDRYRSEAVDDVFTRLGAVPMHPPDDPGALAWGRHTDRHGPVTTGYALDTAARGIPADAVQRMAMHLRFDAAEVFRMLDEQGGKILDP